MIFMIGNCVVLVMWFFLSCGVYDSCVVLGFVVGSESDVIIKIISLRGRGSDIDLDCCNLFDIGLGRIDYGFFVSY